LNLLAPAFFLAGFFAAINSPDVLSRLVHAETPPSFVLVWLRFFTAPLRALSPTGLLTAFCHPFNAYRFAAIFQDPAVYRLVFAPFPAALSMARQFASWFSSRSFGGGRLWVFLCS
jgi:hypothetical protein